MNKNIIKEWLFPNKCLICDKDLKVGEYVCEKCMPEKTMIRFFNITNREERYFFHCESLYLYDKVYRENIEKFKFYGKKAYARKLMNFANIMLDKNEIEQYDLICFVPMNKQQKSKRGYNQTELLALEFSKITGIEQKSALEKSKKNRVQHDLPAKERLENVKGVYTCIADIKGQKILLIDDIITTGATICACAKELYKAGASTVKGICVADRSNEIIMPKER